MNAFVSTETAALAAGVKPATIRKWHERGKLNRYGTSRHPAWRLDEILAAMNRRVRVDRHLTNCHAAPQTTGSVNTGR